LPKADPLTRPRVAPQQPIPPKSLEKAAPFEAAVSLLPGSNGQAEPAIEETVPEIGRPEKPLHGKTTLPNPAARLPGPESGEKPEQDLVHLLPQSSLAGQAEITALFAQGENLCEGFKKTVPVARGQGFLAKGHLLSRLVAAADVERVLLFPKTTGLARQEKPHHRDESGEAVFHHDVRYPEQAMRIIVQ
jgi:hypothetical protein